MPKCGEMYGMLMEFSDWLRQVSEVSKSDVPLKTKRKKYGVLLDGLSQNTYEKYLRKILSIVQKNREECEPFANTEEQVDNILSWLPRLAAKRDVVTAVIQDRRKEYKLTV